MTITVPVWLVVLFLAVIGIGGVYLLLRFSGNNDRFTPRYAYGWGLIFLVLAIWLAIRAAN